MTTHHNQRALLGLGVAIGLTAGCATTAPSQQLVDARKAVAQAETSEAARTEPDELVDARQALDAAEQAHQDDPGSHEEVHLAYLAERRADLAMSRGRKQAHQQNQAKAQAALLSSAKQSAQSARRQASSAHDERDQARADLQDERQARLKAQEVASAALSDLKHVAMVKHESRGDVITLSGSVLFESGKAELLSNARPRLEEVAKALKQQDDGAAIVVEGHTDSKGSDRSNQELSLARAKAVSEFLAAQGVNKDRLSEQGKGEAEPIASNDSAEGRANNRRVEIIIQNNEADQTASSGAAPTATAAPTGRETAQR